MKNAYEIRGETTVIFIKRRNGDVYEFLIDTDDLPKLLKDGGSWCVDLPYNHRDPARKPYAIRNAVGEGGRRKFAKLHRVLTDAPDGKVVDHINGDTLDNRKSNLRVTDEFKNAQNVQKPSRNNKSGALNVYWNNHDQCWVASVMRYGKTTSAKRKTYEGAVEAARQMRNGTYVPGRVGGRRRCS